MDVLLPFRFAGGLILVFLPGAWISFGLPLKTVSFGMKILFGIVLTPLVVALQFYLIRFLGASFSLTTLLLVAINLPMLFFIIKQRRTPALPSPLVMATACLVLVIILISIAPLLIDPQKRLYTWEAWMHADAIYSLARGNLLLQDPDLANVTLSYPWVGEIFHAVFSYLTDSAPVTNYIWLNLFWLVAIFGFAGAIVAELGGNRLSQVTVSIWLSFGVNFVGYTLARVIPQSWINAHQVLKYVEGDNRYTPWLDKVLFMGPMFFGLGLFIAIVYLVLRRWEDGYKNPYLVLAGLLLVSLGIIYSVLLPAAFAIVGARMLLLFAHSLRKRQAQTYTEIFGWLIVILCVSLITFLQIKLLTEGRTGASLVQLNDPTTREYSAFSGLVALSPLLVGLGLVTIRYWKEKREPLFILTLGAAASWAMYALFNIPWWRNEYKYIFTAAICLAPCVSMATQPLLNRLKWATLPAIALITVILAFPLIYKVYYQTNFYYTRPGPTINSEHFDLRLDAQNSLAGLVTTIRENTPDNSLIVLDDTSVHYPTLIQRQLYVAPAETDPKPGILVTNDEMLTLIKGYPEQVIEERRSIVSALFRSNNPAEMAQALQTLLEFHQPLVLLINEQRERLLLEWLTKQAVGKLLYQENGFVLWLIDS